MGCVSPGINWGALNYGEGRGGGHTGLPFFLFWGGGDKWGSEGREWGLGFRDTPHPPGSAAAPQSPSKQVRSVTRTFYTWGN